ncbi:MAG: DNA polymerase III subunit alpha [Candidatus Omnitrophica bacterium]|nr:DNA polymerase III subunit alpha [Candidatus Omnitrophota bacterium]
MAHSDFVHLHVHTQYSLLDGACLLERLIDKAVKCKLPALAITDHGNIYGAIKFYQLCVDKGIKPIIGCECYIAPGSRLKKEYKPNEESNYHLILLAKDEEGYRNLVRLVSLGHLDGFYYRPRIDKEILRQYSKGLVGLSACLKGEIAFHISNGKVNEAYKLADEYVNIFGRGNFYLELMDNGLKEQENVNKHLIKISQELDIPIVCTNDVHYLEKDEAFAQEVLLGIQTQTTLDDPKRFKFNSDTFYFRSPEEMKSIFKEVPAAIKNTLEITQKCNLTMDFSQHHLPHFPIPGTENEDDFLKRICYERLASRYPNASADIKKRLEYELGVICKTGFSSYFIIVWDLIKFAKESGIPVGPGRGSAAGSIVSYILRITDIDPLKYNLIFERFLNPERISMPDIDIDFCYERRAKVLEYVSNKYGQDNVAQIITFGTMQARAVVRDVGRVMGFSYTDVDKIAKMIPQIPGHQVTLKEAIATNPELENVYNSDDGIKRLIDVAGKLEGLSRHASTHAAGVVISDKPLIDRIPLIRGSEGEIVTGFDMESLEKTGLLKMDFLGLKTLTVIDETVKIIRRTRGLNIDILAIPPKDEKTFSLLAGGDTIGVFQLESRGMRDILNKLLPTQFEDLIAVLALYRPGPLGSGMVEDFIERKNGHKAVAYIHPKLEPILKETCGIILYQEQTMQIVSRLAGFSLSRADLLRKAIGKKIPEIMEEQRNMFVQGCAKNNISEKIATQIFDLIDYFSGYGFNKSHSSAYALISYQTAYLKANFGAEFMAALLTSERNNTDKIKEYVNEASRMGIKVLPPDINTSFANFTVTDDGNIRFGLLAIKNVGGAALDSIIEVRKTKKFESIFDFCERVDSRTVNKKVVESLIKSGAMDTFKLKRAQMMTILDEILSRGNSKRDPSQLFFFAAPKNEVVPEVEEWPLSQILNFEKTLLGMYITSHPLAAYSTLIKHISREEIGSFYEEGQKQSEVVVCGVLEKVKVITTRKSGDRMAIVRIEDDTAGVDVFVFPRLFEECNNFLKEKAVVLLKGKLESKEKVPKILASKVIPMENIGESIKQVNILIEKNKFPLEAIKDIFVKSRGKIPVIFTLKNSKMQGIKIKTANNFFLNPSEEVLQKLDSLVGEENLSLTV